VTGRSTAILLLLALSLGAFVYFYELRGEGGRTRAGEGERRVFPGIEAVDISELSVIAIGAPGVRAERRAASWQIVEPVDFPGDGAALDAMAGSLVGLPSEGEIEDPEALSIYGLGDDSREIRFRVRGGDYVLGLGSKTPVGENTYVVAGRPGVPDPELHMVSSWRLASLARELNDLRDRRLLHFDPEAVRALELSFHAPDSDSATVRMDREETGWSLSSSSPGDSGRPLVSEEVDRLLAELASLEATDIAAELLGPEELSALGLRPPRAELRVFETKPEPSAPHVPTALGVGVTDPRELAIFARAEGRDAVYRIDPTLRDRIPLDYEAFASRLLAPSPDAQTEPEVEAPPGSADAVGRDTVR